MENIKIHFAGLESMPHTLLAHKAGVKYGLLTIFPFIAKKFGIKGFSMESKPEVFQVHNELMNRSICDSGLFTLMFGAHAGKRDKEFLEKWLHEYTEFIKETGYKGACVEIDCQKILGVEEAWYFRRKMKLLLPNNEIINVFHLEDGIEGFKKMVEFSSYIAISVPELRIHRPKSYKDLTFQLACLAKKIKPNIKIHLLGCTEKKILEKCTFCTSADSTSWISPVRYGNMSQVKAGTSRKHYQNNDFTQINAYMAERGYVIKNEKAKDMYYISYITIKHVKEKYAKICGSQE